MVFPSLLDISLQITVLIVGVPIVYILSKTLKISPKAITTPDSKKEYTPVILLSTAEILITILLRYFRQTLNIFNYPPFELPDLLWFIFAYTIYLIPLIIVMKKTNQRYASIGIIRKDIERMFTFGLLLSAFFLAIIVFLAPFLGNKYAGYSHSLVFGFIAYMINSFSEELVWRGYVQTRLVASSGTYKGIFVTSLLFALGHFPTRYYYSSGVVLEALASSLLLLPISLLFGYIMLKSQNILPSTIFHVIVNWSELLWIIS